MKHLLQKIKMILKNRRFRRIWYRAVGLVSAVVVFIATYALVMPAITLDVSTASMEPGIVFEQAQYRTPASNVTVTAAENTSEETPVETAAEEVQTEEVQAEEPEQEEPQAPAEEPEPEETEAPEEETSAEAASVEEEPQAENSSEDTQEEAEPEETEVSEEETSDEAVTIEEEPQTDAAPAEQPGTTEEAAATAATEQAAEFQIPELRELDFDEILTGRTGFYYYHNENADAEGSVSSDSVDDWKKADADTVLASADCVRVYLSYEIPAGALNETNQTAHFRLPGNLHITDKQVRAINKFENGIYKETGDRKYLGAEAIEGTRTPDEKLRDGEEEYISALVKVENLSDGGQNLVFTFTPYTIGKNQTAYDQDGQVTAEGQKVKGWFTVDFTVDQIDWNVTDESTETVEAAESSNGSDTEAKTVTATTKKAEIEFTEDRKVVLTLVEKKETAAEAAGQTAMPAQSFEKTIKVATGKVSSDDNADKALPEKAYLTVRAEADEGTFPAGTTMVVTPVTGNDLDAVAEAVENTLDAKTRGFQAVDITFYNAEGVKIEPAKPIRVTMTSDTIAKASESPMTGDPVVIHIDDEGQASTVESGPAPADDADSSDTVEFESDSFSTYVLAYTIDFETVNGGKYSIPGEGSYRLKDILSEIIGKTGVISDAKLDLVDGEYLEGALYLTQDESGDWWINSDFAFEDKYLLTAVVDDVKYEITVTDATYTNLADFITDASLTIDGVTYGNETWPVRPEVDYDLNLVFKEAGSRQFPKGGDEMVMELPQGLTLKAGTNGTFDIPFGLAGTLKNNTWWVDDTGRLHIQFAEDPNNLLTRSSNTRISIDLQAQFDGNETEFEFNDRVSRDVEYDNTGDVTISKNGSYNAATGKMDYVVTVKSTGKTKNIRVTDAIQGDMLTLDENSISISPEKELVGGISTTGKGFNLTIKEMSHAETVTITYSASVDTSKLDEHGQVRVEEDGKNKLTVKPDDVPEKETTNVVHEIKYSTITKVSEGGSEVDENGLKTLYWKITANAEQRGSIVGSTIKDSIAHGSREVMTYPDDLTLIVVVKDALGNTVSTLNNEHVTFVEDNGKKIGWEYVIPQINDPNEVYTYEILYSSVVDTTKITSGSQTVKNNAEGEKGGKDQGTAVVPGTGTVDTIVADKSVTSVDDEYITWKITVVIPPEGYNDGFSIIDKPPQRDIPDNEFGGSSYRVDKIVDYHIDGLSDGEDMVEPPAELKAKKDFEGQFIDVVYAYQFDFTYTDENGNTVPGLKGTGNERTLTLTVKTKNDEKRLEFSDQSDNYDDYKRRNDASIEANGKKKDVSAETSLHTHGIWKKVEGNSLPAEIRYSITFFGVREDSVTLTDEFDTDVFEFALDDSNNGNEMCIWAGDGNANYPRNASLPISDANWKYTPEDSDHPTGITFTADVPKRVDGTNYDYYKVTYYLRVKEGVDLKELAINNKGKYTVSNTATYFDSSKSVDVDYEVPMITKEGAFDSQNERLYHFTIDVNPEDAQLNNGEIMELTDEHTENLSVDYSTVKVYKLPEDTDKSQCTEDMIDNSIVWNFEGNRGTFRIPDNTHYVIKYSALVIGSGTQEFRNVAELEGFYASKSDNRTFSGSAQGGGDILQINLLKYEKGKTSSGLEGATFQLFHGTGQYDSDGNEIKEPMKYGAGPKIGQNITFTTGDNGTTLITLNQTDDGNELLLGEHYYLKEVDSPPGYQIDSSIEYWAFTLTKDPDEVNYGDPDRRDEYGRRQWIYYYYGDILKMSNTPAEEPLTVNVDKSWLKADGTPISEDELTDLVAEVQLLRKTNDGPYVPVKVEGTGDNMTITEVNDGSGVVELTKENDWKYSWRDLPRISGNNKYAYKIEEVNVDGYVVAINETENETTKTYTLRNYKIPEDEDTSVEVEKEWQDEVGNVLPDTTENLPESISFYLYRVTSKEPFQVQPHTGGEKYIISGDSHLQSADDTAENYGLYTITADENWKAVFSNLPATRTIDGQTFFYAYYVRETPLTDYTTTYEQDGETRKIINRKPLPEGEYINIGLQKKWQKDGVVTDPPADASATFTLHQLKAEKQAATGSIPVKVDGTAVCYCNPGETLEVTFIGTPGQSYSMSIAEKWISNIQTDEDGEGSFTVEISPWYSQETIDITSSNGMTFKSVTNKTQNNYSEWEETDYTKTITLPYGSSWAYSFKDLVAVDEEGNLYKYYITEDEWSPTDSNRTDPVFQDNMGNTIATAINTNGQTVVVTNTYEEQFTDFEFYKIWHGTESTIVDWDENVDAITLTIGRKAGTGEDTGFSYTYQVSKEDFGSEWKEINASQGTEASPALKVKLGTAAEKYMFFMENLEKADANGTEYTYFVTEAKVTGYKDPAYGSKTGTGDNAEVRISDDLTSAGDSQYIINTPEEAYELPHTGGPGTKLITLLGSMLLLGAGMVLIMRRRITL